MKVIGEDHPRAVEKALQSVFGFTPKVVGWERCRLPLPRGGHYEWSVARSTLAPSNGLPASVIVKWLRSDPNGFGVDPAQLLTERAALEFLDNVAPGLAPSLVAVDAGTGLLVLEDLQPRTSLYDLLDGPASPDATVGLRAFARALGHLAATRWAETGSTTRGVSNSVLSTPDAIAWPIWVFREVWAIGGGTLSQSPKPGACP